MNSGLRSTPLLYPAAVFAAGIVLSVTAAPAQWYAVAGLLAAGIALLAVGRSYAAALFLTAAIGCTSMGLYLKPAPELSGLTPLTEVEAIVAEARESDSGSRLVIETLAPARFKAIAYIKSGEALFHPGDRIRLKGLWRSPFAPPEVPYEFSMAPYCFRNNIGAICDADHFEILAEGRAKQGAAERARERISRVIRGSGVNNGTADMLDGILLGEASYIDADTRGRFADAGLAHMLAISGTHLAVIATFLSLVFFPLRLGGARRWAMVATLAATWGYVALTGAPASVVRAAVMASFVIAGRTLKLPTSGFNSLCGAAIAILLFSPMSLYSPGFQMSFLAVAGILAFADKGAPRRSKYAVVRVVGSWVAVCVSAVATTAGVSSWLFHKFPLAFLIANIPAAVLLPALMGCGILLILLGIAGIGTGWLAHAADWLCGALDTIARFTNNLDWNMLDGLWFPAWTLLFYYGALALLYVALERRKWIFGTSATIAMATFLALCSLCAPRPRDEEFYRLPDPFCTAWVIFDNDNAWLLTDAPERHHQSLLNRVGWRLREPLAIRGIDSLRIAPDTLATPFFIREWNRASVSSTSIIFIDRPTDVKTLRTKPTYAVVGGHYRHDIERVVEVLRPDTIILSPSLDFAIEEKFAARLDSMGTPYTRSAYRYWK